MPSGKRLRSAGFTPNLTPLLDVVLQLITFFMMLIHFGTRIEGATALVRLPEAPAALPTSELAVDRLAVAIDKVGRLLVDEQAVAEDAIKAWWDDQAARRRAATALLDSEAPLRTRVLVRADRDVPYGTVRRMLATARAAGFAQYSLIVRRDAP